MIVSGDKCSYTEKWEEILRRKFCLSWSPVLGTSVSLTLVSAPSATGQGALVEKGRMGHPVPSRGVQCLCQRCLF